MESHKLLKRYTDFAEKSIVNRFFKHSDLLNIINLLPQDFEVSTAGFSKEGRSLHLIKWGNGALKVFLWSQMHGDEATGTMALMDLCGYLSKWPDKEQVAHLAEQCTLYLLPMVNPDGAERFTRRNALQIDLNRDFLKLVSPEARILKQLHDELQPDFGFNLHDQNTLWSVWKTGRPATLSFLAPAYDEQLSVNDIRKNAMRVIADIFEELDGYLPRQIGLFDDEYEPRAFGDNFQLAGTSTILIEAGGLHNDEEKQEIRRYYFLSVLKGIQSIASRSFDLQDLSNYWRIPKNNKEIFHLLIHQVMLDGIQVSLGLNAEEEYLRDLDTEIQLVVKKYYVQDIGDLSYCNAYEVYDGTGHTLTGNVIFDELANFELQKDDKIILSFSNGIPNRNSY
jgi:hypothetical protein